MLRLQRLPALLTLLVAPLRAGAEPAPESPATDDTSRTAPLLVFADVDDDDDDRQPDGEALRLTERSAKGVLWLDGATRVGPSATRSLG
jgi:hypothetical protein